MPICRNSNFKTKRLRKKYHQKEFSEYGFGLIADCKFNDLYTKSEFIDNLLNFLENNNFGCGGSFFDNNMSLFITKSKGSCTECDIKLIVDFLKTINIISNIKTSNLLDCWNIKDEDLW